MSHRNQNHQIWIDRGVALGRWINKLGHLSSTVATRIRHINIIEPKTRATRYWVGSRPGTQSS
jgi:hypothetical protein